MRLGQKIQILPWQDLSVTSHRSKLATLELGRFIAAFLVVICHAAPYLNGHAANPEDQIFGGMVFPGQLGVQYFFVLSGFVMASAHHADFGHIRAVPKFWWRRACRIYPAYWLALIVPLVCLAPNLGPMQLASMALLNPGHTGELIPAAWSLRYELAFYIMFGFCLLPYIGKPLLGLWVFITIWRWHPVLWFIHPAPLLALHSIAAAYAPKYISLFEFYFFVGLAAGLVFVKWHAKPRFCAALLAGGGVLFAVLLPREDWGNGYGTGPDFIIIMAAALGAIMLGLAGLERQGRLAPGPWAGWLGAMSYPLYLTHEPVMMLCDHVLHWDRFTNADLYAHGVALIALSLMTALLVTWLFDQPVQRGLRRLSGLVWRQPA